MSKKINLDEFWNKRYPHGKLPKYAKDIIIEYSKELLELAAGNAKITERNSTPDDDYDVIARYNQDGRDEEFIISTKSILDTINQIE